MLMEIWYAVSYALMLFGIEWFAYILQVTFFKKQMRWVRAALFATGVSSLLSGIFALLQRLVYSGADDNIYSTLADISIWCFIIVSFVCFKNKKILCCIENFGLFLVGATYFVVNLMYLGETVFDEKILIGYDRGLDEMTSSSVLLFNGASLLVVLLMIYVYFNLYKTGKYRELKWYHGLLTVGVVVLDDVLILLAYYREWDIKMYTMWFCGFLLLLSLLSPILIVNGYIKRTTEVKNRMQEEMIESEMVYIENYKEKQEETRRIRHDMNNNLTLLSMLVKQGKYEEVEKALEEMSEIFAVSGQKIISGDSYLDCILTFKSEIAAKAGIDFSLDGILDKNLSWSTTDIVAVFGNAIDNAIEECQKIKKENKPYVDIKIRKTDTYVIIRIENPVAVKVDTSIIGEDGVLPTTKEDKEYHGYGLSNIKRVVKKHDGIVKCQCDEKCFVLSIMINMND